MECLEPRRLLASGTGEIHGTAWSDLNANGAWDDGETGLAGVSVYLDTNGNGQLDVDQDQQPLEPMTVTASDDSATSGVDETGIYQFTELDAETYTVAEVVPTDHESTFPAGTEPLTPVVVGTDIASVGARAAVNSVAMSPEGRHVCTTSALERAVQLYRRDEATGDLSYVGRLLEAQYGNDGLDGACAVVVSPDGAHVYVAGRDDDALTVFERDPATGELTFAQLLKDGVDGIDGLDGVRSIVITPDGRHIYAAAYEDDAVTIFQRNAQTGVLTLVEMKGGFEEATCVAMSPDGAQVYAVSGVEGWREVTAFRRDDATGRLTSIQRITIDFSSFIGNARSVVVAPDGRSIYVTSGRFLFAFERDPTTGRLASRGKLSDTRDLAAVAVNPDGRHVYVSYFNDTSSDMSVFERDTAGRLTFASSLLGSETATKASIRSMVFSPDGSHIYAGLYFSPHPEERLLALEQHQRFAQPGSYEITLDMSQIVEDVDFGNHTNNPPQNTVPAPQTSYQNAQLVFAAANGNAISVTDPDTPFGSVEVTLTVSDGTISLTDVGGLAFSEGDGTNDRAMTFLGPITNVNAALDGMQYHRPSGSQEHHEIHITTRDLGHARPGGEKAGADTILVTLESSTTTELGTIDFLELPGADLSLGTRSYRVETARPALLTIEAAADGDPDSVQLVLYNADPFGGTALQPLATSTLVDGRQRIDYPAGSAGQSYYFTVGGSSTSADLLLANLVDHQGTAVTVHGTDDDDRFEFSAVASRMVTINSVRYAFENAEARSVAFDGGAGRDVVVLTDSPGDETFTAEATHAVLSNADETAGFTVEVDGFEELHAYARAGGTDTAYLHDTDKSDKFRAETAEHYAKMYGGQIYNRVKFFNVVEAFYSGGKDLARVFDTKANDTFVGQKDVSWLTTADPAVLDVGMHNFPRVIAFAYEGGSDKATLKDSELKDEFHGKSHKSQIFDDETNGSVYEITARRFDTVYADGSDGDERDVAKLWETVGDDYLEAADAWARLWNEGTTRRMLYEVLAFDFVKVRASTGGNDRSDVTDPLAFQLAFEEGWDT